MEWRCGDPAKRRMQQGSTSATGKGIEAEFSSKLRLLQGKISCRFLFAATFSLSFLRRRNPPGLWIQ
jgi:hypothetical protein